MYDVKDWAGVEATLGCGWWRVERRRKNSKVGSFEVGWLDACDFALLLDFVKAGEGVLSLGLGLGLVLAQRPVLSAPAHACCHWIEACVLHCLYLRDPAKSSA
jgi:hypothetical protein